MALHFCTAESGFFWGEQLELVADRIESLRSRMELKQIG